GRGVPGNGAAAVAVGAADAEERSVAARRRGNAAAGKADGRDGLSVSNSRAGQGQAERAGKRGPHCNMRGRRSRRRPRGTGRADDGECVCAVRTAALDLKSGDFGYEGVVTSTCPRLVGTVLPSSGASAARR